MCYTSFSPIYQFIMAISFIDEETGVHGEKTDLSHVTDKPYHTQCLLSTSRMCGKDATVLLKRLKTLIE
jgi:hypothetical protein